MKIESSNSPLGSTVVRNSRAPAENPKSGPVATGSDDVTLSSLSARFPASDDDHAFDAVRVSEIKQAIAEGRFTINAGAIAERLITSAKELVNAQRQA